MRFSFSNIQLGVLVFGIVLAYHGVVKGISCMDDEKWETRRCANVNPVVDENTIILIAEENSRWPVDKFCYAFRKNMKVSGAYEMSVDFLWIAGGQYPSFIFNMWDECNYDHLHKEMTSRYVMGDEEKCGGIKFGPYQRIFPVDPITPPNKWYNLKIKVDNNRLVQVFLNNVKKGQFTATFSTRGFGGVAIPNGYSTTMKYRNFQISPIN